jgi:pyridinium-3,5-biscarboxylic acid mononucleotide sulfurtransferase
VRHPYVEAGIGKSGVRDLARSLGLGDLAELPASPCLSSRVETAIPIEPAILRTIHQVERLIANALQPQTVRCRVRKTGIVIELDGDALERVSESEAELRRLVSGLIESSCPSASVAFAPYRAGSAFVRGLPS